MVCCTIFIFSLLPPWAEGNTIKIKNEKDEAYYCESYKSPATVGSLIKFEKCGSNPAQKSWEWIPIITSKNGISPVKTASNILNSALGSVRMGKEFCWDGPETTNL